MRNLQKILALALALIMSFSLVVTANAAFSDEADIDETYSESVKVLSGLEVFRGYTDGSYKPQDSITRAEVAAIIYRIATGDVSDSQVSLYSDWNRFKDVASGSWYAGYVNYCANAEYIKGYEDGSFRPNNNVTGYEALAMILRAVGYGKMDEFVGSNWAVNTAARANTLKISKNVTAALLGSPASREVVAELLFRSILVPTVTYNNAFGYQETDTTLGYDSFKLEAIEGVVVANEYANLYDTQVLGTGKTDFEIAKDDVRSLNIASELTAIGEAHYAYVSGSTVYALENTGDNTVWEPENGKGTTITGSKFLSNTGLKKDDNTEFYFDFGREGHFSCDQRLEFTVIFGTPDAQAAFDKSYENISKVAAGDIDNWTVHYDGTLTGSKWSGGTQADSSDVKDGDFTVFDNEDTAHYPVRYNRVIRAEDEITAKELEIIRGIFAAADNDIDNGLDRDKVIGDVFVGTKSTNSQTDEERDVSNSISYRKFVDEYINSEAWDQDIESSKNGQWLKVVDNDGDGIAEYAFLTQYYLDEAVGSYTKSGETILEFNSLDVEDRKDDGAVIDIAEGIAVGDVVLYTDIDNRVTMTKAESVKAKIKTVNFKDETCTTTDDVTYNQSGIANKTDMDELVVNMDDQVDYNIYFDKYGYARAYELANGNQYGLLTELYWSRGQNGQYVTNAELTVEMKAGKTSLDEYTVSNKDNEYLLRNGSNKDQNWADLDNGKKTVYDVAKKSEIVLQPAIGQLGLENNIIHSREFEDIFTKATTNVGVYVETGDGEVRLTSPVKYAANTKGERLYYSNADCTGGKNVHTSTNSYDYPAYEIDFVELNAESSIAADARRYNIATADDGGRDSRYVASKYVNAVHDTEYYILDKGNRKVDYFTDYDNVYAIDAGKIIAAYAVARNTEYDSDSNDYWVADVIVIEVSELDTTYDSTSILYTNPSQTSGSTKSMWGLNTEYGDTEMIPENKNWDSRWDGNWAYEVDEKELKDDILYANGVDPITVNYNARGLYAGIVDRVKDINKRGAYIDVRWPDTNNASPRSAENTYGDYGVYSVDLRDGAELIAIGSSSGKNYETRTLFASDSDSRNDYHTGDRVIWGVDKDGDVTFVLNIDYVKDSWVAPEWLTEESTGMATGGLWYSIAAEQTERHNAPDFEAAMAAYRKWVKEGDAYLEAAKGIIQSAINGGKLSAKEKAELEKLLATMEGDDPTVTPDEIGKLEVSADAPQAVKDALTIQSWAGKDYAYVNITDDDMTITELLGYLTAGGKDLSFVDAIDRTNGPLTADRTASAAKKITAKIGGTIFIINVTAEADPDHAKQFFTVNYTEGQATVTLKNGGTAVKSGEPLAKDTVVVIKYITDGFKDHATKDKDGNAVTGTGTNSEEFTLTKDLYVTATALTAADIADAKLTAALAKVPATIGYETKLEADHTEAKTKAYIKELVEKAIADSSVTVAVAIKTSEVYTAPTVKGTAVTNKFTITLSAENMTAAQTVNKDVACKFTSTAADEEAAAITAAVKSAINAKYSVTEYDSWAECKAAIIEAIEGVEGVTEVTALTIDPDFESDTIWEGGRYCTITFTFKWTDSAGAEQTASNIEANISTIK